MAQRVKLKAFLPEFQKELEERPDRIWTRTLDPTKREIRILHLHPATELHAPIVSDLRLALLDEHPEYEAISYAWGNPNDTLPIRVNGEPLPITKSLHGALLRLREHERLKLWADAICMHQANIKERNHQVRIMRDIYQNAQRVNVWLGEADPELLDYSLTVVRSNDLRNPHPTGLFTYQDPIRCLEPLHISLTGLGSLDVGSCRRQLSVALYSAFMAASL
jgi:hypothetical protein